MDQIVKKLLHIKVRGLDDQFKVFHDQLAAQRDKFSRPHDVLLENVRISSGLKPAFEIFQEDEVGVSNLVRLICSLPIVVQLEGLLQEETACTYKGLTPDNELTVILEQQMRENHLSDIVPLIAVPLQVAAPSEESLALVA